jgi:molybdenum cofactor cytidylyltransferase
VIAGVLLAAGGARRFGSQKLVAPFAGRPLVWHAAAALVTGVDEMFVVVGCDDGQVLGALDGMRAHFVVSERWMDGLSASLRAGIASLPAEAAAVVIALGDQPGIDVEVIRALVRAWRGGGAPIVAARYDGSRGHPVLFARSVFDELLAVTGDAGARDVIDRVPERVAFVDVARAVPGDVDVPGDLRLLTGR